MSQASTGSVTTRRRLRNIQRFFWAVVLPLAVGYGLLWLAKVRAEATNEPDVSESVAALIGAVIGITGTHLGHKAGNRRRASDETNSPTDEKAQRISPREVPLLVVVGLALLAALTWGAGTLGLKWEAVAALAAAVIGVTGVHVIHDLSCSAREARCIGPSIIILFLGAGVVAILLRPDKAEGWAALAAACVSIGGAQTGHAGGYSEGRAQAVTVSTGGPMERDR